jgi:DNA-binding NarL/FixJ family response regulator
MIRLLLVDDQDLVRAGLRMLCEAAPDIEVIGEARNGSEALRLAAEHRPDVILMDLHMPVMDGTTTTRLILQNHPATRIVILTTFDDDEHLYPAITAGATGFLTKDADPDELLNGIRRAAHGDNPYSTEVLHRIVNEAVHAKTAATRLEPEPTITSRERDVLALLGQGLSNKDIADHLALSITTVKTHIARLMDRTGSNSRVQLALLAARHNIRP